MRDPLRDPGRVALVSNTASGANRRRGVDGLHARAAAAGLRHYRIDTIESLDDVMRECADVDLLVLNAGDGTVCRVLDLIRGTGAPGSEPMLALLRGGTTNMIHKDVGWPGPPDRALAVLLERLGSGRWTSRERHPLRVRPQGRHAAHHGFFFGTNALVRAILRTRDRFHARGSDGTVSEFLSTTAVVWRLLRRRVENDPVLAPAEIEISCNGEPWRRLSHVLLMATSLRRVILGVHPLARGQRAGLAELHWPGYRLLPWLWRLARGRLEALHTLSLRGEIDWILDGEVYRHRPADGVLSVDTAAPARFLVEGTGP